MASKDKRVTTGDIAKYVGVSQTTVSLVLNGRADVGISEETERRVREAAIKLGYMQPTAPVVTMTGNRQDIAFIVPDIINPSFSAVLAAASLYAFRKKVGLLVCNTDRSNAIEREYITQLVARNVGGILYTCAPTCSDLLEKAQRKIPVVVVGDTQQVPNLPTVATAGYRGGEMLAQYLHEMGHRHFAYITPPVNSVSVMRKQRLAGISDFLKRAGVDAFYVYEHTSHIANGNEIFEIAMGQMQTERILKEHPGVTAIIAQGDLVAIGAYKAIKAAGLRIPDDLSVVGFDNIEYGRHITPALTTIDTKMGLRVEYAFETLIQLMSGKLMDTEPLFVDFRSSLVVRESAAPPRAKDGG